MNAARYPAFAGRWVRRWGMLLIPACLLIGTIRAYGLPPGGGEPPVLKAAVLVSRHIRPYLEAVEGLRAGLSQGAGAEIKVMEMTDQGVRDKADLVRRLSAEPLDIIVGIGPEAGLFIWHEVPDNRAVKLYLMVLNPDRVFGSTGRACGVSLNIPVSTQVRMIRTGLPSVGRVGLLFDPEINADFQREALAAASRAGIRIAPLPVASKKDIPSVLENRWGEMDALWLIPDRTVVSESIVHHVIKEAFVRKVPVIGFNRFFYEAGAAMAFVFDYEALGRECAQEALRAAAGNPCRNIPPVFEVWVNPLVAGKLGLKIPETYDPPVRLGP